VAEAFSVRTLPGFTTVAMICFFLLYLPIATLVLYAFNAGESIANREGASLRWFVAAWNNEAIQEATLRSLVVALVAASVATLAATRAALATTRTPAYPGLSFKYAMINQPLMVPEIVTAVALLHRVLPYQGLDWILGNRLSHAGAYSVLHPLRLSADKRSAAEYGPDPRTGSGGPLRTTMAHIPACDATLAAAGDHCRLNARLRDFTGRCGHYRIRQIRWSGNIAHLHAGPVASRGHARDKCHLDPMSYIFRGHRDRTLFLERKEGMS